MAFRGHALERSHHFEYAVGLWPFGAVQVLRERRTDRLKLCKTVRKELLRNAADAMAGLRRLRDLRHEHIGGITQVEEDRGFIYIISDQQQGGDLAEFISRLQDEGNWLQEETVAEYIRQMLIALAHAHGARTSHRDLRLSSLALSSKLPDARIVVTDIGLAEVLDPAGTVLDSAGSPFAAPELRGGGVALPWSSVDGALADVWSVGAIAHQLLVGTPPPTDAQAHGPWSAFVLSSVGLCHDADAWGGRSDLGRDFVESLLRPSPRDRPTAAAALQHAWLRVCRPLSPGRSPEGADVSSRLLCYVLAVVMLPAVAQYRDLFQVRSTFMSSDSDRDGFVPSPVAHRILRERGATPSDAAAAVDAVDVRLTGTVSLSALLAAWFITEGFCGSADRDPSKSRRPRDLAQRLLRGFFQVFGDAQRGVASASSVLDKHAAVVVREVEMHAGVRYEELLSSCLPDEGAFGAEALSTAICDSKGRGTPVFEGGSAADDGEDNSWGESFGLVRVQDAVQSVFQSCGLAGATRGRCDSQSEIVRLGDGSDGDSSWRGRRLTVLEQP